MKVLVALAVLALLATGAMRLLRRAPTERCPMCGDPIGDGAQPASWCPRCWWEWQI